MLREFQRFIMRGNVIDLAIGVVIGAAFTAIVNSLVDDILMPLIGVLLGGVDFSSLSVQVGDATIAYGAFIQSVITFLLISLSVFLVIRGTITLGGRLGMDARALGLGGIMPVEEAAAAEAPEEVRLLAEIRDLLKAR